MRWVALMLASFPSLVALLQEMVVVAAVVVELVLVGSYYHL
jgi:hypothetical protein